MRSWNRDLGRPVSLIAAGTCGRGSGEVMEQREQPGRVQGSISPAPGLEKAQESAGLSRCFRHRPAAPPVLPRSGYHRGCSGHPLTACLCWSCCAAILMPSCFIAKISPIPALPPRAAGLTGQKRPPISQNGSPLSVTRCSIPRDSGAAICPGSLLRSAWRWNSVSYFGD